MQTKLMVRKAVVGLALLATGCGSTSQPAANVSPSPSVSVTGTTIAVASNTKLGEILVDGSGKTVYLFVADTGTASTCYSSCATLWPPVLTTGAPTVGTGAQASLLGTTTRTDGKVEVTYAGHPLYYFISDTKAGDATGQGVNSSGGLWWVLTPSGAAMH